MKNKQKLIFSCILLLIGLLVLNGIYFDISFFSINEVLAVNTGKEESGGAGNEDSVGAFVGLLETILKAVYILLWPLLVVGGASLDNSLVYGTAFNLDPFLWQFWNLMKNFANYALGFIFIFSILVYIFDISGKTEKFSPKKILPKLLIAGVGIQASWFIVGAIVDLSTIAVYGIGAMPLHILENNQENVSSSSKVKVYPQVTFDIADSSSGGENLDGEGDDQSSGGDENGDSQENSGMSESIDIYYTADGDTNNGKYKSCVVTGGNLMGKEEYDEEGEYSTDYCVYSNNLMKIPDEANSCIYDHLVTYGDGGFDSDSKSSLTDLSKGMTGPLMNLYSSLLRMGDIALVSTNKSISGASTMFIIKTLIALALMIPLLALCVVLIVRVVVLWMVIGFSPLIVIKETFDFKLGSDNKFSLSSLLGLIFLPVTAVFALSISIIFLTVLNDGGPNNDADNGAMSKALGVEIESGGGGKEGESCDPNSTGTGETTVDIPLAGDLNSSDSKSISLSFIHPDQEFGISPMLNIFSWLVIQLFGIGLMWAIVFAALKTSKITDGIVSGIESFATSMAKSAPIIPAPTKDGMTMVGVGGAEKALSELSSKPSAMQGKQAGRVMDAFEGGDNNTSNNSSGASFSNPGSVSSGVSLGAAAKNSAAGSQSNARQALDNTGAVSGTNDSNLQQIINRNGNFSAEAKPVIKGALGAGTNIENLQKTIQKAVEGTSAEGKVEGAMNDLIEEDGEDVGGSNVKAFGDGDKTSFYNKTDGTYIGTLPKNKQVDENKLNEISNTISTLTSEVNLVDIENYIPVDSPSSSVPLYETSDGRKSISWDSPNP